MTVKECIIENKYLGFSKLILCPDIVPEIRVNVDYIFEGGCASVFSPDLLNAKVIKSFKEGASTLAIIYDHNDYLPG